MFKLLKAFRTLAVFLCLAVPAFSQGVHRINVALVKASGTVAANVVPFAKVTVCVPATFCGTLQTVYADMALTQTLHQPITADASGNYSYYYPAGCVDEEFSSPGQGKVTSTNVCAFVSGGALFPNAFPKIVVNTSTTTSRNAILSDFVGNTGIWTGTPCSVGTNVLLVNGQCGPGGTGTPAGSIFNAQFNNSGAFGGSAATFDGPGNFKSLSNDGLRNAFLNQTTPTSNNGIANSLANANSTVTIGPDYANVEGQYTGTPCAYRTDIGCPPPFANNTILYDYRLPTYGTYAYNTNMGLQNGFWLYDRWISNRQAQASGTGSTVIPYQRDFEITGSGKNGFGAAFGPDSFVGFQWNFEFMRRGIVNPITLQYQAMGVGDGHIWQNIVTNNRGCPDGSCEGFNTVRNQIGQNLTPMSTTANATLAAGATLIQGTLLGNNPFPGDGSFYINASHGSGLFHIITSGNPGDTGAGDAGILTIDTLTLTPDNIGRVAAAVTVPPQYYGATTNETVTVTGLTSAIVTTSTVCYANNTSANMDAYLESARVVSVGSFSSGTQTITVALRYGHGTNSYVVQGSHACTSIDIRANQFPGTLKGRQILRIIGAIDATHLLYSRIGAGHWLQALSGYASTRIVAAAGVTLTRNGSNVSSVTVTDPFLVLSNDFIIVSGCTDTSFNGLFVTTSNDGSTLKWTNTGSAGTTTCTNAIEIQSQLNGLSVREAQLFPAVEIVNTVDPVTFANNFNLTVEPNTNFVVTAGDQLEDQVYSEVGQGLDHNLISFKSQVSPSIADVTHNDILFDQIPEGTTWYSVTFQDTPNNYLGLGGTKPILNTLFEMEHSATPFNFLFHGLPTPATAAFTFNGCLYGCTDVRSSFDLFVIPINGGNWTETIHQDTGIMNTVSGNGTQISTFRIQPEGFNLITNGVGTGAIFLVTPGDTNSLVAGGAGTNAVIDQTSSAISSTVNGTLGVASHLVQTKNSWTIDVPITVPSCTGCGSLTGSVTTTGATTDVVTVTGMTASGHCAVAPTNAAAGTMIQNATPVFIDTFTTNAVTLHHVATGGATFQILCTPN